MSHVGTVKAQACFGRFLAVAERAPVFYWNMIWSSRDLTAPLEAQTRSPGTNRTSVSANKRQAAFEGQTSFETWLCGKWLTTALPPNRRSQFIRPTVGG